MADIRLKRAAFEAPNGKKYELACTFNTLADLEESFGTVYAALTSVSVYKTVRVALASMLNDYNEEHKDPERFTPTQAGRLISPNAQQSTETCNMIVSLIVEAVKPAETEEETKN